MNSNPESVINHQSVAATHPQWVTVPLFFLGLLFTAIYWVCGALLMPIVCLATKFFLDEEEHRALGQKYLTLILGKFVDALEFFGFIQIDDAELQRLKDLDGPVIIASNHPAMWDALLIMRRVGSVSCIMKASLLYNPVLCGGAKFAGFLPNAPNLKMIHGALERLNAKERLLLFPEGTRSRKENGKINPFRTGVAVIARKGKAPVMPVFIKTNSPYLGKGWPIWRIPQLPISISIRVGEQQAIEDGETTRDFSQRLEQYYKDQLSKF